MNFASLFFNVQIQVVCHMIFLMSASSNLLNSVCFDSRQVKYWRFFIWLDKYLDMVEEVWMINVLIMGNGAARSLSQEMQRRSN